MLLAGLAAGFAGTWPTGRASANPMAALKVGGASVETASDGTLSSSLAFMLPDTPREDVEAVFKTEGQPAEATPIPTNASLVRIGSEVILIDAGSGNSFQPTAGKLGEALESRNIPREAITQVVFTHAHPDHLWGAVDDFDDSERFSECPLRCAGGGMGFLDPRGCRDPGAGLAQGPLRRLATDTAAP